MANNAAFFLGFVAFCVIILNNVSSIGAGRVSVGVEVAMACAENSPKTSGLRNNMLKAEQPSSQL